MKVNTRPPVPVDQMPILGYELHTYYLGGGVPYEDRITGEPLADVLYIADKRVDPSLSPYGRAIKVDVFEARGYYELTKIATFPEGAI